MAIRNPFNPVAHESDPTTATNRCNRYNRFPVDSL